MKSLPSRIENTQLVTAPVAGTSINNPAVLYLASLGSVKSRRVMQSRLRRFAGILGVADWQDIPWQSLDRPWLLLAKEAMSTDGCSPQTINAVFSLLKGVA